MSDSENAALQLKNIAEAGAKLLGASSGAAIGGFVGGPVGALAGAAAGSVLESLGNEWAQRKLGPRQMARTGALLLTASQKINAKLDSGEALRCDGFFDAGQWSRSKAEEVSEAVVAAVQSDPEEKKLPYMANILVNVAFEPSIVAEIAQFLIKGAESLTYRQLCIFKVVFHQIGSESYRTIEQYDLSRLTHNQITILYELHQLTVNKLINHPGAWAPTPHQFKPSELKIGGFGAAYFNYMKLAEIPNDDCNEIVELFCKTN